MIKDHEIILWIGGLNYWMGNLDCVNVKNCLAKELMEVLKLQESVESSKAVEEVLLGGFREQQIGSIPTYSYDAGPVQVQQEVYHAGGHPGNQAGCNDGVWGRISSMISWCFIIGGRQETFVLCWVLLDDVTLWILLYYMSYNVIRKYQMIQVFSTYVESLTFTIQFSIYLLKCGSEQLRWDSITFPDPLL